MPKKYSLLTPLLFSVIVSFTQEISRQEADSMMIALTDKQGNERDDLLLNVAQYHIFKEGESLVDFDSAAVCIREAEALIGLDKSSTTYGFLLLMESYLARKKGQMDKGKRLAEEAVCILESSSNKLYLGRAYYELSMYYSYVNEPEVTTRMALVGQAVDAFQKAGDLQAKARSLEMLGDLYISTGDMDRRISILKEALATYDSVKYQQLQGVYVLLGDSYMVKSEYGPALSYLLKALRIAQLNSITSNAIMPDQL